MAIAARGSIESPMSRLALSLILAAALAAPAPAFVAVAKIEGIAGVKDGDGILFGKVEVRLQGVAAPEYRVNLHQEGGAEATAGLNRLALGRHVVCELDGTTANRRPVGICYVAGLDVGGAMIRAGLARDCPAYSGGRYAEAERLAQAEGHDLSLIYPLPDYC